MSTPEIESALAWADRISSGQAATYDPYIVALARVVREQRDQIAHLESVLGIEEGPADWDAVLAELHTARRRLAEFTQKVGALVPAMLETPAGYAVLNEVQYIFIFQTEAKHLARAIRQTRELLGAEE